MTMHIGHVALRVPDPDAYAEEMIRALGLREAGRSDAQILLTANEKHHELQLIRGSEAALDHVGLELESEQEFEELRERIASAGCEVLDDPCEPGISNCFRFLGPLDILFEVYSHMERDPLSYSSYLGTGIRRLGHLTFLSSRHRELEDFLLDVLGFRVSDRLEDIAWLRCDTDHHGIAVGPREDGDLLHHYAWEVQDLSAIGKYCDHIGSEGMEIIYGPVRHGPGFNLATYRLDPLGCLVEVYSDLCRIYDDEAYEPVDWSSVRNALNLWGPGPSAEMMSAGIPCTAGATQPA
jgi:catechol 2,3-dioxygenase